MIVSTSRKVCYFIHENVEFKVPGDNQDECPESAWIYVCRELGTQWAAAMDVGIISAYVVIDTKYVHGPT